MKWSGLETRVKIILGFLFIVGALAGASAIYNWYADKPVTSESEYVATPEIKKAQKIEHKKIIVTSRIDVLDKEKAVKELKINDPVKSDDSKQITATAEIAPYDGKTNVISVLDTSTGMSEIIAKQEPLSFFGFENDLLIYAEGGINTKGNIEIGGGLQWDFARAANTNIGAVGELRGSQDDLIGFAGLRFTYHKRRN